MLLFRDAVMIGKMHTVMLLGSLKLKEITSSPFLFHSNINEKKRLQKQNTTLRKKEGVLIHLTS